MNNLVMGVAAGYGWHDIEPFVISCRKNCPDADLVLFVDEVSKFTENKLNVGGGAKLYQIPEELKNKSIVNSRWEMYKNFLKERTEYENIFLTDIRDVIFQGDLFAAYRDCKNSFIYSTENVLIKDDPTSARWIKNFIGNDEYLKIQNKNTVCAGIIFGSYKPINIFLEKMVEILKQSTGWGDDQAAMNYLVHNKLLPIKNIFASNTENGELLNMYWANNRFTDNKILRDDGKTPAVIHEYDRFPEVIPVFDKIYREETFDFNEKFNDTSDILDQIFCLVQRQNWSVSTKLFVNYIFYEKNLEFYGKYLLKLYKFILQRYDFDSEVLISAVQQALVVAYFNNVKADEMEKIYDLFVLTSKVDCCMNPTFKKFVKSMLVTFIDYFYKKGQYDLGMKCTIKLHDWSD